MPRWSAPKNPSGAFVLSETVEEVQARGEKLDSLLNYDSGVPSLNAMLGYDVSAYDPDGPFPSIPESN